MYADEKPSQMYTDAYVRVQHCDTAPMLPTPQRSRASVAAPEVPGIDRMCRSIPQPGKGVPSAFIRVLLSAVICDEKKPFFSADLHR